MPKKRDAWDDFTPDENRVHDVFNGETLILPELEIVGWLRFKNALPNALLPWRHKNWYEILYMEHGQVDWWVEDTSYNFSSGSVLIISPNELHGAACGVLQPCEHYWLRFRFPSAGTMNGLTEGQQKKLQFFFEHLPSRLLVVSNVVKNSFEQLIDIHRNRTEFAEIIARHALLSILCELASESRRLSPPPPASPLSPVIQKILHTLQNRLHEPPSVKEMSKMANMSEGTFRMLFEKETGMPPNNYINIQRIRKAKDLLQEGYSITYVAFELGFSSSQYFSTVFKKWAGISPSDYLKNIA